MPNIHLLGIGGIGMSAVAQLLLSRGCKISGCDSKLNPLTKRLKDLGAIIYEGHSPAHIDNSIDLVVHSSAIKKDAPELAIARELGIPVLRRAEMLADIIKDKEVVAVTGTHGKTTTSFMITHILEDAGLAPGFAIGGEMEKLGGNARWNDTKYFVVEADESDGTQLYINPRIAVVTNIDCDHLEFYSDLSHISGIMQEFIKKIPANGLVIGYGDDPEISRILTATTSLTYGWDFKNDIYAADLELEAWSSVFFVWYKGNRFGPVRLSAPGRHNVLNGLAGIAVCVELGVPMGEIISGLNTYPGVKRRLDVIFRDEEITVMDDYAHHPSEIRAVVDTARGITKGRIIGVFQPHRFTRTKALAGDFGNCFAGLDKLILTDIYSAGELPIQGVTGRVIYDKVMEYGDPTAIYIESKDDILGYLLPQLEKGDTVIFMGAGDITELAHGVRSKELAV